MIRGFFQPRPSPELEPWPMVSAFVLFPRFGIRRWVHFLVDTGADKTSLHLHDARNLVPDFSLLTDVVDIGGVGADSAQYATEPAELTFLILRTILFLSLFRRCLSACHSARTHLRLHYWVAISCLSTLS